MQRLSRRLVLRHSWEEELKHARAKISRRRFLTSSAGALVSFPFTRLPVTPATGTVPSVVDLFAARELTPPESFTKRIEGPAVDRDGNIYAVNYDRLGTIGKVTPDGRCSRFIELPDDSIGNGIRFNCQGEMLIADYINHNILKVDMQTRKVSVLANVPTKNQPNDIAIGANDIVYASDPDWQSENGQIWRIDPDGTVTKLESDMGTTNGIEVGMGDQTLFVNESIQRNVWAYDLSDRGEISNKRLFIRFEDHGMDGMRCDVAGNLYITRWGKGTIVKLSPAGKVLTEIYLSGKNTSNLCFGGPDGRTIYVTVTDHGNIETFRVDHPGRAWDLCEKHKG